jgi:hypothetical protein
MEIINNANCRTCESNVSARVRQQDKICNVFNLPVSMYSHTTRKHGCNSYVKDVNKMEKLPEETNINGREYILWDIQYSQSNAEFSAETVLGRVPKSSPEILMLKPDNQEPLFGVYVKKELFNGEA